jgi:FlaA1/EpsC-like NDP-sugar epimerase
VNPAFGKTPPPDAANEQARRRRRTVQTEETALASDFAGKTALVTGAGRGIGRAVALGLGVAGAREVRQTSPPSCAARA